LAQVINGPDADSFGWQFDWYFPELAALFIVLARGVTVIMNNSQITDSVLHSMESPQTYPRSLRVPEGSSSDMIVS